MSIFRRVLRAGEGKKVRALEALVPDINAFEPEMQRLDDAGLKHKTVEFREQLDRGELLDDLLIEAFAVTREAALRTIGQRHYDVQMMGGAALHFGWIAEMKTGEGKTLVSTLPVYLNGLTKRGVHVVTVNDYLAKRDSDWMGQVHRWLGLTVGLVIAEIGDSAAKRAAYNSDVTYSTNSELGFDYLRDNMAMSLEDRVQRKPYFSIVDEVDSILIDEARTPHIISGRVSDAAKLYVQFSAISRSLQRDVDYEVDEEKKQIAVTEEGIDKVEESLGVENIYDDPSANFVHHLNASIRAKELFKRDVDYLVQDGEVKIIDEFTGRILDGRRWSEGLHQAVEAKERVKIKEESQTLATTTLQNYFRLYEKLAGMTGTAETEASEFGSTYNLNVVPIRTHRPLVRLDKADLIYKTEQAKFEAVADDLAERHAKGQPVLVGTVSVEKSELVSRLLQERGIPHAVLNAKYHEAEAEIVAQAGRLGSITVATNMAGRGVDILLGGNPEGMARRQLHAEGINPDLVDIDLESPVIKAQIELQPEYIDLYHAAVKRLAELKAEFEVSCKAEGDKIRELGGLYVLGTERHESRRIDNQLRGRAGRQGDPGESRFYLSLEDELMRLFATGAMNFVMGKALPDDVPIEAKMVSKAIERAQTTVESRNAEIRKNVLKYDEVMNEQRKVIYAKRDQILDGADLREQLMADLEEAMTNVVNEHTSTEDGWNLEAMLLDLRAYYPSKFTVDDLQSASTPDQLTKSFLAEAKDLYEAKEADLGPDTVRDIERNILLSIIDQRWLEHLGAMDYLQEGINLRAMGQKDPLVEWQREGFDMFGRTIQAIDDDFVRYAMHAEVIEQPQGPDIRNMELSSADESSIGGFGVDVGELFAATAPMDNESESLVSRVDDRPEQAQRPIVKDATKNLGRNEPCHCGSGKKFKNCHGR